MRCPYCNYELTDDAIYCDNCDNLINGAVPNTAVPKQNKAVPIQNKAPGFFESYILMWKNYANFNGRTRRRECWLALLCSLSLMSILLILIYAAYNIFNEVGSFLKLDLGFSILTFIALAFMSGGIPALYVIAAFIPTLSLLTRRLHDSGHSGKWLIVPILCNTFLNVLFGGSLRLLTSDSEYLLAFLNQTDYTNVLAIFKYALIIVNVGFGIAIFIMALFDSQKGINKYGESSKYPNDNTELSQCGLTSPPTGVQPDSSDSQNTDTDVINDKNNIKIN